MKLTEKQLKHTIKVRDAARELVASLENLSPTMKALLVISAETKNQDIAEWDAAIKQFKKLEADCQNAIENQEQYK